MSQSRIGARALTKAQSRHSAKAIDEKGSAPVARSKKSNKNEMKKEPIVIDEKQGLVFQSEKDLFEFFKPQIEMLETEVVSNRAESDIPVTEHRRYESLLQQVIDDPDEVWEDAMTIHGQRVTSYVGHFAAKEKEAGVYYVALTYNVEGRPRFVYLHFPSRDLRLVDRFRRGDLVYDRVMKEVEKGAVEGDALSEGDALAVGLYKAMLTLRSNSDIKEDQFHDHEESREPTIEDPDEIWRTNDLSGNTLVTFIKHFDEGESEGTWYVAVTVEDQASSSHALLFSFPTQDEGLLERYRHGENLQAEEVTQEASH